MAAIYQTDLTLVVERVLATVAVQVQIADVWIWEERTVASWETDLSIIDEPVTGLATRVVHAETLAKQAAGALKGVLDRLHDSTVTAVELARVRYRAQPELRGILRKCSAGGTTRVEITDEAEEWELAWEEIEPGWVPVPGLTLAAFSALRAQVSALLRALRQARVRKAHAEGRLHAALAVLETDAQAWYASASSIFREGTEEREMLAGIPTTYTPAKRQRKARSKKAKAVEGGEVSAAVPTQTGGVR